MKNNRDGRYVLLGPDSRRQLITIKNGDSIERHHDALASTGRWIFTGAYEGDAEICQWMGWTE